MMLEHIFLSVLSTSLSVGLITILLMILSPFIDRRYAAKWKYLVWILLALRLVVPIDPVDAQNFLNNIEQKPIVEENKSENELINPAAQQTAYLSQRIILEMPSEINEPLVKPDQVGHITLLMILEVTWLAGCILFLGIHLYSYLLCRSRIRRNGRKIALKPLGELADELRLSKTITLVEYVGASSPMVTGFLHPVLVLPAETYSDEELYFIMKHELIHYMRHDVYWKLLFVLANAVHWFNPAVWLMHREAVVDMELSCDERVVSGADHKSKKAYTETLYATLYRKYTQKYPLSTQFYGGKRIMKRRFRNILGYSVKRNGFSILIGTAILMIATGLLIGCSVSDENRLSQSIVLEGSTEQSGNSFADGSNTGTVGLVVDSMENLRMEDLPNQKSAEEKEVAESLDTALPESITLTYIMEGEPEEQTASLYIGDGYAIYVPDDDWQQYEPDRWRFVHNDKIRFWVTCYEDSNLEKVKKELGDTQALLPDTESDRENEMEGQKGDMITRVRLLEQAEVNCVWAVFYSYPEEAMEGAGARLPVIADTICLVDRFPEDIFNLWKIVDSADSTDQNVLEFQNGLQLIFPEEWMGKTILEISIASPSAAAEHDNYIPENRLAIYEKNNAEAHYGGELIHLDYVRRDLTPYIIYGQKAAEIYRVLGVYRQDDQEYALIYAKYPEDGYDDDDMNVSPDDPELQNDYQDLYALADDVQIITDHISGFTKCDVNDLDWIYIEGLSDTE